MSTAKYCENCGCKVFNLGCVNCDEENYIEEQERENNSFAREKEFNGAYADDDND